MGGYFILVTKYRQPEFLLYMPADSLSHKVLVSPCTYMSNKHIETGRNEGMDLAQRKCNFIILEIIPSSNDLE